MKVIFVGDNPSPKMKPDAKPFEGAACEKRIVQWLSIIIDPKSQNKYTLINAYRADGSHTLEFLEYYNVETGFLASIDIKKPLKFVAIGNNASKALKNIPHFKLPHPSGRNRQINNKKFIEQKLMECKRYLEEI